MVTPTTTDIQISTDTNFSTLTINENINYITTRTFPPGELPYGVNLYMRIKHHTDDASMDTPWSDVRSFKVQAPTEIIGVCMDNSDTTKAPVWDWIDKDGNKVDTFDYTTYPVFANAEGVTVTDASDSTKSADFIKIPKFYVKTIASGPINTFAAGKKCWWISDKPLDDFRVHPAFLRKDDGTAVDYVSICVNTAQINVDARRAFDIYDFGLCVLLTYIQCKQTMIVDTKINPLFPNVDLGIRYLAWDFDTIITGNYYYPNWRYVSGSYHVSIKNCMQLIDSPIPKISTDKLASLLFKSAQTFIALDDINDVALKLESNNELYLYYDSGQLKSGSVSIDNITIDFMDLFIPDLSLPPASCDHYFYDRLRFTVSNDDGLAAMLPTFVLMCYTSHLTSTVHFSPLCPRTFKEDDGTTDTIYDAIFDTIFDTNNNYRVCLK